MSANKGGKSIVRRTVNALDNVIRKFDPQMTASKTKQVHNNIDAFIAAGLEGGAQEIATITRGINGEIQSIKSLVIYKAEKKDGLHIPFLNSGKDDK